MADDEEIICKGTSLYKHLTDLGYADFGAYESKNMPTEEPFGIHNEDIVVKINEGIKSSVSNKLRISHHDYNKLSTILSSQLLIKEDAYLVQSLLENTDVYNNKPNFFVHTSTVLTGVVSSVMMYRNKVNFCIPLGFTALFSCYSAWHYYKEFKEGLKYKQLDTHINDLKLLCFRILKLMRFVKETEILSSGQIPVNNVGSALYAPSSKYEVKDLDTLPDWKTLPHLRKCLLDSTEESLNILIVAINSLRKSFFNIRAIDKDLACLGLSKDDLELKPQQFSVDSWPVSVLDLKNIIEKYLSIQSEYLKELSYFLSSVFLNDLSYWPSTKVFQEEMFNLFVYLNMKLTDTSFKLMMQYKIHNISPTFKKVSNKKPIKSNVRDLTEMHNNVHNVFLLLYSALLKVRSLEDSLENLSEIGERLLSSDKMSLRVREQLDQLKDDLSRTVNCYNMLCHQATSKTTDETRNQKPESISNLMEDKVQETGIIVGTSDFRVTLPDEVFLSLSGINPEEIETSDNGDNWYLGRKPEIPKSLLTELSNRLKSRKADFAEREKQALLDKGLEDIENQDPSSEDDSEESNDNLPMCHSRNEIKYKRHARSTAQEYSYSSDSDDEMDPFESGAFLRKLKNKKYQPDSDSESSSADVQISNTFCRVDDSESRFTLSMGINSIANQIAIKSQMWGKTKEDKYSDGSASS